MSHLIKLDNISLSFGSDILLEHVNLQILPNERVCLIGRNGAGKSSLLKLIEGTLSPDSGSIFREPSVHIARLSQELPSELDKTLFEFVAESIKDIGTLLSDYESLTRKIAESHQPNDLQKLHTLQQLIDNKNGWQFEQKIKTILKRLELDPSKKIAELSGGWQRRAALAKVLVTEPELLLLDEPTNHLDIEGIQWLEDTLEKLNIAILFITHDRSLLQRLATRIVELDRGQLTSWPGDYKNYLEKKEHLLNIENRHHAEFDKKLAQEEQWIRQGIKARRTRNEGRVRALESLRAIRAKRRTLENNPTFNINTAEKSGELVIEAKNITQQYDHRMIINDFSFRLMRGDKVGLIGPNGTGKSTLLNILLGKLVPQTGSIRHGTKLKIAYFDQLRKEIDLEKSVVENVGQGCDFIEKDGKKQHIISYLKDFLFTAERAQTPVKVLSGGECNRLLLARLFSLPKNLLVLDEPTNDLDIESLELLEELLSNYQGTILLVSHDRAFLDNVVTSTLSFEQDGKIQEYIGGYQDWLLQKKKTLLTNIDKKKPSPSSNSFIEKKDNKLNYKEQQELIKLPGKIELLENEKEKLQTIISTKDFYLKEATHIASTLQDFNHVCSELDSAYQRWEELEQRSSKK